MPVVDVEVKHSEENVAVSHILLQTSGQRLQMLGEVLTGGLLGYSHQVFPNKWDQVRASAILDDFVELLLTLERSKENIIRYVWFSAEFEWTAYTRLTSK